MALAGLTDPTTAKKCLEKLMDTRFRVTITDGRKIIGDLWCIDNAQNFVLLEVKEMVVREDGTSSTRSLGPLVMVPGRHVTKVEAVKKHIKVAQEQLKVA
mmetsp:Transcript_6038/g.8613  ORF Transcript_6038/g.8613 Transcript_6038/m.8613 type:complete len:100 (-) Transcript_6038:361-660(-)